MDHTPFDTDEENEKVRRFVEDMNRIRDEQEFVLLNEA